MVHNHAWYAGNLCALYGENMRTLHGEKLCTSNVCLQLAVKAFGFVICKEAGNITASSGHSADTGAKNGAA